MIVGGKVSIIIETFTKSFASQSHPFAGLSLGIHTTVQELRFVTSVNFHQLHN